MTLTDPELHRKDDYKDFTALSLKKIRLALLYIKAGYTMAEMCSILKISKQTIYLWANNSDDNKACLDECFDGRIAVAQEALFKNVQAGDQRAIEFMLERRSRRFKKEQEDPKIHVTNQQIIENINMKFGITLGADDDDE